MTNYVTIAQRQAIFTATCELLRLLIRSIADREDHANLNSQLCRRVIRASMRCPGFSPLQKDDIAYMANLAWEEQRWYGQPPLAHRWVHQYAIAPKADMPHDLVEVSPTLSLFFQAILTDSCSGTSALSVTPVPAMSSRDP